MSNSKSPISYIELLQEMASLTSPPRVWNAEIGLYEAPASSYLEGETLVSLGCYSVEQDLETGESILWHTFADGPEGYQAQEPEIEIESNGGWPIEEDSDHFLHRSVDKFSWSLINTLAQAVNGFLDENHVDGLCLGLDQDFCAALRNKLLERLEPLQILNCECGEFARREILALKNQLHSNI